MDIFNAIGDLFYLFLINPLTNLFVLLTTLTGNAGLGVILLTLIIRLVTFPLQRRQMHTTRMMAALQPRMQEINKKYKDPRRRQQEQMKLYREAGFNPLGCFSSFLIQIPILAALYRTFILAVGEAPESLVSLQDRLYNWDYLRSDLPLPADFLWLHLGQPDPFILPILVAASTFVLQKVSTLPSTDERQRAQAGMMNFMMPLIFGWITISLPSGLGLYYVLSNIIGIVMQYVYVGGGPVNWRAMVGMSQDAVLPRAMEARERQMAHARNFGPSSDDESDEEESPKPAKTGGRTEGAATSGSSSAARRRRRRYGRGGKR
jgi:YidC/Oxa1 family membrane protein insertase